MVLLPFLIFFSAKAILRICNLHIHCALYAPLVLFFDGHVTLTETKVCTTSKWEKVVNGFPSIYP